MKANNAPGSATTLVKHKLAVLSIVAISAVVAFIVSPSDARNTIFFSTPHAKTNTTMPSTLNVFFDVTNTAARGVLVQVVSIERQSASAWLSDTQSLATNIFHTFGRIGANKTAQLSINLPHDPAPTRFRVLVSPDATVAQKARFAMIRLWANVRDKGDYKEFWITNLVVPSYQIVTPEIQ